MLTHYKAPPLRLARTHLLYYQRSNKDTGLTIYAFSLYLYPETMSASGIVAAASECRELLGADGSSSCPEVGRLPCATNSDHDWLADAAVRFLLYPIS